MTQNKGEWGISQGLYSIKEKPFQWSKEVS